MKAGLFGSERRYLRKFPQDNLPSLVGKSLRPSLFPGHACLDDEVSIVSYPGIHNMTTTTFFPGIDGFARSIGNMVLLPDRFLNIGDDPKRFWPN